MADTDPVAMLRETLARYLNESFGTVETDSDGDFAVRRGSTVTYVRPVAWAQGQTIVRVWSITNRGVRLDGELARFLATESGKFIFGGFQLDAERQNVLFGHTLLGDFLSRKELSEAIDAVSTTADFYDDQIQARFGGTLFSEPAASASSAPAPESHPVHRYFGLLGLAAGIGAAIAAFQLIDDSWWLVAFAFLLTQYVVGRSLGDLATDPHKLRRAFYFALQPALSIAIVYFAYQAWERWWLAVLLGFLGGGILAGAIGAAVLPGIHQDELADTKRRWRTS
ncbi:MAG: YbjN domain-containing protein [Gaiellaceae bacterium]